MKKRIGNDIEFTWHIYRKSGDTQTPESFDGKDVEVKLISPLQQPVTIEDVSIDTGVVTFVFKGKYQTTLGNYVAVLLENKGEDGMVTLDVVNAVTLVLHSYMEEDGDDGDVIEAESVELTSTISAGGGGGFVQQQADWAQTDDTAVNFILNKPNLDVYCRKDATNVHTGGYDQYIHDFVESIGNVTIDAQALWVRLLYPNGELVSETRVGPGNIRIVKNGVTLNLNPAYFQALVEAIDGIRAVIPEQASSSNQLADKNFVNSGIATATATFRGAYNLVTDLHLSVSATHAQIATALATTVQTADNNDYCYVQIPTADATPTEIARIDRYKYDGTAWAYEYGLNNSSFTAAQWAALNSGITSGLVAKLSALPTNSELTALLSGKANTANLATVATSGSYNDLTDKPSIPDAQVQSDWNETDTTSKRFIRNKPKIGGTAADVSYDNTRTDLSATNVQDAIDEMADTNLYETVVLTVGSADSSFNPVGQTITVTLEDDSATQYTVPMSRQITFIVQRGMRYNISGTSTDDYRVLPISVKAAIPTRYLTMRYIPIATGVFILQSDGNYYLRDEYDAETMAEDAVGVLVLTSGLMSNNHGIVISKNSAFRTFSQANHSGARGYTEQLYNGYTATQTMVSYGDSLASYCWGLSIQMDNGTLQGFLPAQMEGKQVTNNLTEVNNCLTAIGGTLLGTGNDYMTVNWNGNTCCGWLTLNTPANRTKCCPVYYYPISQ